LDTRKPDSLLCKYMCKVNSQVTAYMGLKESFFIIPFHDLTPHCLSLSVSMEAIFLYLNFIQYCHFVSFETVLSRLITDE